MSRELIILGVVGLIVTTLTACMQQKEQPRQPEKQEGIFLKIVESCDRQPDTLSVDFTKRGQNWYANTVTARCEDKIQWTAPEDQSVVLQFPKNCKRFLDSCIKTGGDTRYTIQAGDTLSKQIKRTPLIDSMSYAGVIDGQLILGGTPPEIIIEDEPTDTVDVDGGD